LVNGFAILLFWKKRFKAASMHYVDIMTLVDMLSRYLRYSGSGAVLSVVVSFQENSSVRVLYCGIVPLIYDFSTLARDRVV
jgi:hypothetical protein